MKRFTFSVPQNILFGEGVLKELPGAAGKLGGKHGFIISGPTLNRLGVVGQCGNPDTGRHRSQYFLRHGRKSICRDCGTGSGSI